MHSLECSIIDSKLAAHMNDLLIDSIEQLAKTAQFYFSSFVCIFRIVFLVFLFLDAKLLNNYIDLLPHSELIFCGPF